MSKEQSPFNHAYLGSLEANQEAERKALEKKHQEEMQDRKSAEFEAYDVVTAVDGHRQEISKLTRGEKPESAKEAPEKVLSFDEFKAWIEENDLDMLIDVEAQLAEQGIDRSEVFVRVETLPAKKAGLENGCVNQVLPSSPESVSVEQLKSKGMKVWAEKGKDRWTKLELDELLQRSVPVEPEEFDAEAFTKDWVAEVTRIIEKGQSTKAKSGKVELILTSNLPDIPRDQKIVNKDGEVVAPKDRSYISAIANKVRVLSQKEGMRLAELMWVKDKTELARNTWEWRRDLVDHRDKKTKPPISVAHADSDSDGLGLYSSHAGISHENFRFRLAL